MADRAPVPGVERPPARAADVVRALASVEAAVLVGAAGVTAFATSAPWFLALGVAGWGILAWDRLGDLRQQRALAPYRLAAAAVDGLGEDGRHLVRQGHRAGQVVLDEIASAPDFARRLFEVAAGEVREVYGKYVALVRRLDEINRYLAQWDTARLERERDAARRAAEGTDDEDAKQQYLGAVTWLEEALVSRRDLARDAARIVAQLAGIRAALESAGAKVVRVKSAEARGAAGEGEEVARALSALGGEVDALNEAVDEVFVRSRQATRAATTKEA